MCFPNTWLSKKYDIFILLTNDNEVILPICFLFTPIVKTIIKLFNSFIAGNPAILVKIVFDLLIFHYILVAITLLKLNISNFLVMLLLINYCILVLLLVILTLHNCSIGLNSSIKHLHNLLHLVILQLLLLMV